MSETTKVVRKGHLQTIDKKDLKHGDLQFETVETEKEVNVGSAPLPGTKRVSVLAIGPYTNHAVKANGRMLPVPQWVVLTDGRALKFHRLFNKDGTADVDQGEVIFPGGAVFRPCEKTAAMQRAERENNSHLTAARLGLVGVTDGTVLH